MKIAIIVSIISLSFTTCNCSKNNNGGGGGPVTPPVVNKSDVDFWLTQPDQAALFKKQSTTLLFTGTTSTTTNTIEVDSTQTYQSIDGFGYTLTGGSATLINTLPASTKDELL